MNEKQPLPEAVEDENRRRRGRVVTILAVVVLLLVAVASLAFFALVDKPLRVSKETTYITSPLKSDGRQVDYFVAWEQEAYPKAIATDDNGYRLIVQHLGASSESTPGHFAGVCRKLGLDAGALVPDMKLEEPFSFLKDYVAGADFDPTVIDKMLDKEVTEGESGDEESSEDAMAGYDESYEPDPAYILESRLGRPWTLDDLPMMEAWLAENNLAMDMIGEAVRRPVFHIPHAREDENESLVEISLPHVQDMRSFARALNTRAKYRIGTGNIDGAIDDIISCKRLGRHAGHSGNLIEMLVGIAIEAIADSIGVAGSLEYPPTKERLERLVVELNDLPPVGDLKKAMLFERFQTLDFVQSMAHGKGPLPDYMGVPVWVEKMGVDWSAVAKRVNTHYDTLFAGGGAPSCSFRSTAFVSTRVRSESLGDALGGFMVSGLDAASEAPRRRTCSERIHRITLAMWLYESDHGTLPPAYTVDANGNALHSWRVSLLPYLGQRALYDKIRLDEPWDSEHNRTFHYEAVDFCRCPSAGLSPGQTTYSVVVGRETAFVGAKGKKLADFGPKSASMILVVERALPVCWMNPTRDVSQRVADIGINVNKGAGGEIASPHPGGANFGLRNGGCSFLCSDCEVLKGLLRGTVEELP